MVFLYPAPPPPEPRNTRSPLLNKHKKGSRSITFRKTSPKTPTKGPYPHYIRTIEIPYHQYWHRVTAISPPRGYPFYLVRFQINNSGPLSERFCSAKQKCYFIFVGKTSTCCSHAWWYLRRMTRHDLRFSKQCEAFVKACTPRFMW
jgi:hypothetical protein